MQGIIINRKATQKIFKISKFYDQLREGTYYDFLDIIMMNRARAILVS